MYANCVFADESYDPLVLQLFNCILKHVSCHQLQDKWETGKKKKQSQKNKYKYLESLSLTTCEFSLNSAKIF